jgi:Na+/glutamate symporter
MNISTLILNLGLITTKIIGETYILKKLRKQKTRTIKKKQKRTKQKQTKTNKQTKNKTKQKNKVCLEQRQIFIL